MKRFITLLVALCLLTTTALAETTLTIMSGSENDFLYDYLDRHEDIRIYMAQPNNTALVNEMMTNPDYCYILNQTRMIQHQSY